MWHTPRASIEFCSAGGLRLLWLQSASALAVHRFARSSGSSTSGINHSPAGASTVETTPPPSHVPSRMKHVPPNETGSGSSPGSRAGRARLAVQVPRYLGQQQQQRRRHRRRQGGCTSCWWRRWRYKGGAHPTGFHDPGEAYRGAAVRERVGARQRGWSRPRPRVRGLSKLINSTLWCNAHTHRAGRASRPEKLGMARSNRRENSMCGGGRGHFGFVLQAFR